MSKVKAFICDVLKCKLDENNISSKDVIKYAKEDGYSLTRKQIAAILYHQGKGVSLELVEKIYESFDWHIKIIIYKDD